MEERSLARKWWTARWDGINAKRGYPYSMNPWAYGYGFEVLEARPSAEKRGVDDA
jgi:hypothetical protein